MMCVVVWTAAAGPRSGFPTDSAGARVKQSYRQKSERSGDADLPAKLIGERSVA